MTKKQEIPRFFLYGDQATDVELDFLHMEAIRDRSGPNNWTIRAHAHPDHVQLLLVEQGGGELRVEAEAFQLGLPSLVVVPAAMVHEFDFVPGTDGLVINAAGAYVSSQIQGDVRLSETLGEPAVYALDEDDPLFAGLQRSFVTIGHEYTHAAPGRRMAISAQFQSILVALLRLRMQAGPRNVAGADRDYEILCRYRDLMDQHFRAEKGLDFYASRLSISTQRLNLACKARVGKTASEILHERIVIEAKRGLIYMEKTVAEVGYDLGFDDPAYFSRFFSQRVGQPPGAYREARQSQWLRT